MLQAYPLSIRNDRKLPENYSGPVFVWDIDKTYLSTRFSSWRGLARVPVEFSIDKQAIPGMPEVLRGLRRGPGKRVACSPLFFISASPPFLRGSIEGKMLHDGVEHDGITFKDWWKTLLQLRPDRLLDQLGFKTAALLSGRLSRVQSREYLFGDDYEKDAEAFSLYARGLRGQVRPPELEAALAEGGVKEPDRRWIAELLGRLPRRHGRVAKIYIHLEKNTSPQAFRKFGRDLVPVKGALQLVLALFQEGLVDTDAVLAMRLAVESVPCYRFGRTREMLRDALARKIISRERFRKLRMI